MEMYSKAVSEMYAQFKQREDHPLKKYVGRLAKCGGKKVEVVGYSVNALGSGFLIVDTSLFDGWRDLSESDVVFKRCDTYGYVTLKSLID